MSMNFEVVFEKYKNGTATEEERAYVEAEIAKARKLNEVIGEMDARRVVEPAEAPDVKKAMKKMNKKNGIRIAVISFIVVVAIALATVGGFLLYVNSTASNNAKYGEKQCIQIAKDSVADYRELNNLSSSKDKIDVGSVEKDLDFERYSKISSAYYTYEIEIRVGYDEYEVSVNSVTGRALVHPDD